MCVDPKKTRVGDKVTYKSGVGASRLEVVCRVEAIDGSALMLKPMSTRRCGRDAIPVAETFSTSARNVS